MNEFVDRMSGAELETYARSGALPDWFLASAVKGPTRRTGEALDEDAVRQTKLTRTQHEGKRLGAGIRQRYEESQGRWCCPRLSRNSFRRGRAKKRVHRPKVCRHLQISTRRVSQQTLLNR